LLYLHFDILTIDFVRHENSSKEAKIHQTKIAYAIDLQIPHPEENLAISWLGNLLTNAENKSFSTSCVEFDNS
jgi:hypothetical protein